MMNKDRFDTLTNSFSKARVMVVGDIYLDETNFGVITEMSLEAPIPVFELQRRYHNPGAAGNVATNLAAMGAQRVEMVGIVGQDVNADIVKKEFKDRNVSISGLVVDPDSPTNTYGKFRAGGETYPEQEILRSDTPRKTNLAFDLEAQVIESIKAFSPDVDAIVVVDQVSYAITPDIINTINECAKEHKLLTVADSRERIGMVHGFDVVLPNELELAVGLDMPTDTEEQLATAAKKMLEQAGCAFITRGPDGITSYTKDSAINYPTFTTEVVDVTGAGDTVTSATTLTLLANGTHEEAAIMANGAAANAVRQLGAVTVTRAEIESVVFQSQQSQSIVNLEDLQAIVKNYQSKGQTVVWTNGCFDILHAGHVTYLMDAAKQGDVLIVGLNSDASVSAVKGLDRPIVPENERALIISSLECVDHVVVFGDSDTVPLLDTLKPDIYAKGGDYTIETINQDERVLVESYGGSIALILGVDGRSTTNIIQRLSE